MRYLSLHIFFFLFSFLVYGTNDTIISISKVTPKGGVVNSQVSSIIEDNNGFIWFSTYNGLFSYNSIEIKRYSYSRKDSTSISSNRINSLFKDKSGKIWIATENGLCTYNPKKDNFIRHAFQDQIGNDIGSNIISFFQDNEKNYWFSDEKAVGVINPSTHKAIYKNLNHKTSRITFTTIGEDGTIWVFYDDGDIYFLTKGSSDFEFFKKGYKDSVNSVLSNDKFIWIGYQSSGLLCMNIKKNKIVYDFNSKTNNKDFQLPGNRVRSLIKRDKKQIWVATDFGIAIIENFKVKYVIDKQKYSELPHHSIYSLYKDSNKNIWIGTWLGGLAFQNKYNNDFKHFTTTGSEKSISSNFVSCFAQVPNTSEIIVGTDDGDLNLYNPGSNTFRSLPVISNGDTIKRFKSLTFDKYETLWAGTYGNGVLYREKNEKYFKRLDPPFPEGVQTLDLLATDEGIWISNYRLGVYFYEFKSKEFSQYKHNPFDNTTISNNFVTNIIQDKNKNIWFATRDGLNLLKKDTKNFISILSENHISSKNSPNYISTIFEDNNGFLWLGTNGEGLNKFDPIKGTIEHFTVKESIAENEIFSILQDHDKNLWIATEKGICKFNPQSKKARSFTSSKGIKNNHFYPLAALKSTNGDLYFGGSNGFIRFQPNTIITNPTTPITTITQLLVDNEKIIPETDDGILNDAISQTEKLKLSYKQNSIRFQFACNNYVNPQKNKFKYRLVNFDDKWIESSYNGRAAFTNIPPGDYIFEVKASNNDGIWNDTPTKVAIEIAPPIWLTWYAYLFYFLIFISAFYFYRKQVIYRQKFKMKVKMAEIQREREEELHQMKLEFFTNISHEFRTPLTLIQGPVNRLLKKDNENDFSYKQLSLIKNNTDRLLRLINQFLDFRRIDHGKLKLNPIHQDIVVFTKNVFNCFEELATQRSFNFNFISESQSLKMDFDTDKLDKVLVNLLSNAFKYSANQGDISLTIKKNKKTEINSNWYNYTIGDEIQDDFIEIGITDSGYGISSEKLPKIFERFFQIKKNHNNPSSTGIGLSLLTNYINLHKGQLVVSSLKDEGTAFYIYLPLHQPNTFHKTNDEPLDTNEFNFKSEPLIDINSNVINNKSTDNQESLILITEDNPELLDFLGDSLQNYFKVVKATNGREALELANSLDPDLIISDIMMPEMDGIELCEKIKNDIRTSHIPFILLTALSAVENRISGIQSGADAYIPKPFDENFLITQINNLLTSRKKLRALFASQHDVWNDDSDFLNLDKKLLLKAKQIVEKNINNTEFTVEELAKNVNLSRTHLYRKLKSLTNQSSSEFIRNIRLKHAIKLMKTGDYMINEIGYSVGFNSHNYFTKAFKKQYGMSPREFLKKNPESIEEQS